VTTYTTKKLQTGAGGINPAPNPLSGTDLFIVGQDDDGNSYRSDLDALATWLNGSLDIEAANVSFTPSGSLSSNNVQGAIEELDAEKLAIANHTALSVVGRSANSTGDVADIAAGANDRLLTRVADALGFTQLTDGMVPTNTVGLSKLINSLAQYNLVGRKTSGAGAWEECTRTELNIPSLETTNLFLNTITVNRNVTAVGSLPVLSYGFIGNQADGATGVIANVSYGNTSGFAGMRINGTAASPSALVNFSNYCRLVGYGYDGTNVSLGAVISIIATETWSGSARGSRITLNPVTNGTTAQLNNAFGVENNGDVSMGSSTNIVIDANRLFRLRQYTVATLPAAGTAGRRAAVTDALAPAFLTTVAGGGAINTPVYDNGANWVAA
jgi:hypothetical protein